MILIDNINFFRKYNKNIRELLREFDGKISNSSIKLNQSNSGVPTLQMETERSVYIHSKYDPILEAERIIESYSEEIPKYKHVFFYGLGLGYHVEMLLERFPNLSYTLYEPNPEIFYHFMSYRKIEEFPIKRLKHLFVETNSDQMSNYLNQFAFGLNEKVLLIPLPSYSRLFSNQYEEFISNFREIVKNQRSEFHVNVAFEKRWTINSIINFPEVLQTPNVLSDIDKMYFKDKTAIIVSAGPSLADEIDNLRLIKEKNMAFIFSVGSSINSLIEYGIYPHAACTYDPSVKNQAVFEKVIQKEIDSIPLIFGTSVGFELLSKYLGPKLHMVTNQDTVTPYYLNDSSAGSKIETISDAPSIAIITLQLLYKLGIRNILLVGQNLAFKNDNFYAKGVNHDQSVIQSFVSLRESAKQQNLVVDSVDGEKLFTTPGFLRVKSSLELFIKSLSDLTVINTTKGGAKIEGTEYVDLHDYMNQTLKENDIEDIFSTIENNNYNKNFAYSQQAKMDVSLNELTSEIERITRTLTKIDNVIKNESKDSLDKLFNILDQQFNSIKKNDFYHTFLHPMLRVQYVLIGKEISSVRFDKDIVHKGKTVLQTMAKYIYDCKNDLKQIYPVYLRIKQEITNAVESSNLAR